MFCFKDISGCNLIGLSSSIAIYICENFSDEEVNALGAFFTALGDNLALCIINKDNESCKDIANKGNKKKEKEKI